MGPLVAQGTELANEMVRRDRERAALTQAYNPPAEPRNEMDALSPETVHLLGGLLDAGSTYAGMKMGKGREGNSMVNAVANQSPEMTGLTVAGGVLGSKLLAHLIRKKSPKVADALQANLGAQQMGLGGNWMQRITGSKPRIAGSRGYMDKVKRNSIEQGER